MLHIITRQGSPAGPSLSLLLSTIKTLSQCDDSLDTGNEKNKPEALLYWGRQVHSSDQTSKGAPPPEGPGNQTEELWKYFLFSPAWHGLGNVKTSWHVSPASC